MKRGEEGSNLLWTKAAMMCGANDHPVVFLALKILVAELLFFVLQAQPVQLVLCASWPGKCWAAGRGAISLLGLSLGGCLQSTLLWWQH